MLNTIYSKKTTETPYTISIKDVNDIEQIKDIIELMLVSMGSTIPAKVRVSAEILEKFPNLQSIAKLKNEI